MFALASLAQERLHFLSSRRSYINVAHLSAEAGCSLTWMRLGSSKTARAVAAFECGYMWLGQALVACGQGLTTPHPFFHWACSPSLYCDLYLCWGYVCSIHLPDHRSHSFVEESELLLLSPVTATYLSPVAYTIPEDQCCIKYTRPKPHCVGLVHVGVTL